MKRLILVLVLIALALPVLAQEFPDVPPDHWAYQAVQELLNAGVVQGYPDGTYGGKRAMTRYEFAEAVAKAIPYIEQKVLAQVPAASAAAGTDLSQYATKADLNNYVTKDQLAALQKLVDEFRDELAALGVDVEALRRDVAALNERVTAIEAELARVRFTGVGDIIARAEMRGHNSNDPSFDRDGRSLTVESPPPLYGDSRNPLANSAVFENFAFGIKAKAGEGANLNALINAGNYMNFVLNPNGNIATVGGLADFLLWNMNADAALKMGPLGVAQIVAGRQSFQLTPLTMKFVDPDTYTYVPVLDSGDYVFDGARATFNFGKVSLTAFADKANAIGIATLVSPKMQTGDDGGIAIAQVAGVRAVIGTPLNGNLGLTWYEAGLAKGVGRNIVMGADLSATIAKIGFSGEYARSDANDEFLLNGGFNEGNFAWNAKLSYEFGKLGIGGGYVHVAQNYNAPGYWLRSGRAVNLQNVKGATANLNYAFGDKLSFVAEGQMLTPDVSTDPVTAREAINQGQSVATGTLDNLMYWRAGMKYALTSANTVDLGWERSAWSPDATDPDTTDTIEQYISIGIGHTFNANSSMKLLYQIVDFTAGGANPYGAANYRGDGVAAAQFELKY